MMRRKVCTAIFAVAVLAVCAVAQTKYEAEDGELSGGALLRSDAPSASGGSYVRMEGGNLKFTVSAPSAGFYTVTARYSQTYGNAENPNKTQDIHINGSSVGSVTFPPTHTSTVTFQDITLAGKVNLNNGANTIEIRNSWGWVDIDYIIVARYEETPFNVNPVLVTANASVNARKVYQFMRQNFTNKIISGVMTGYDLDKNYNTATLPETKHVFDKSGKYPALIGLDFIFSTGQAYNAGNTWNHQYHSGMMNLAEEFYGRNGILHFMWHWRNPMKTDDGFYIPDKGNDDTNFDIRQAFTNGTLNKSSAIYDSLIADIDRVAGYFKTLADKDIPVLWRPLHEAGGGWFWWGHDKRPEIAKSIYIEMFDRMVNHHGLKNLIWIWTCDGAAGALDWYPGDDYVDIIGHDFYAEPQQYGSLVSNFETIKETYGARKIIALSENGPVPHPANLVADGAGWSFFMPWNENYLTQSNSDAHWNTVMNHDYVLSLDEMPDWATYDLSSIAPRQVRRKNSVTSSRAPVVSVRGKTLNIAGADNSDMSVRLVNVSGRTVARFKAAGKGQFSLSKIPAGRYVVETRVGGKRVGASAVVVR